MLSHPSTPIQIKPTPEIPAGSAIGPGVTQAVSKPLHTAFRQDLSTIKTLALDLGTHTGRALLVGGEVIESGTLLLATDEELATQQEEGRDRTMEIRFVRFLDFLEAKLAEGVTRIVFEDVMFTRGTAQAQLWSSLRAAIWSVARRSQISVCCVPVATLKKFATSNGGAQKSGMAQALAEADPARYTLDITTGMLKEGGRTLDDNEVDAIWIARFTAAVDRGEQAFTGVHQRKAARKAEKRARRAAAKAQKKARREAEKLKDRAERSALLASIKATGQCCGVFRKPSTYGWATCTKCGRSIRILKHLAAVATQ